MKRLLLFLFIIVLGIAFIGCGTDDYSTYMKAIERSENLESGEMSTIINGQITFNEKSIDELFETNLLNNISEEINYEAFTTFKNNQSITRIYIEIMGEGYSSKAYITDNDTYIEMDIIPGFIKLPKAEYDINSTSENEQYMENSINDIINKWKEVLQQDDIVSGENVIIDTIDGSVKAKRFTVNITNEQMSEIVNYTTYVISENSEILVLELKNSDLFEDSITTEKIEKVIKSLEINDFDYEAYIDMDGYLVEQKMKFVINFNQNEDYFLQNIEIEIKLNNWDYNKDVSIDMPDFENAKINTMDEIENLFENK